MEQRIRALQQSFDTDLQGAASKTQLTNLHNTYLSKKHGATTLLIKELPNLSPADKKRYGPLLNKLKAEQQQAIEQAESILTFTKPFLQK